MSIEEIAISVPRRAEDDTQRIAIPGAFVAQLQRSSNHAILFVTGFSGKYPDYMDNLVKPLGRRFAIYATQMRRLGIASGDAIVRDLCVIDEKIRDRFETDSMIYIGHSMGLPMAVEAASWHGRPVAAYIGLSTYPDYGACFSSNPIKKTGILEAAVRLAGRITGFGPLAYPLKDKPSDVSLHAIIADHDEVTFTIFEPVRKRFLDYFNSRPNQSAQVVPGNHCFNARLYDFAPFNKDSPSTLIEAIFGCLNQSGCL